MNIIENLAWGVIAFSIIAMVAGILLMIKSVIGIYKINKEYDAMQKKHEDEHNEIIQSIRKDLAEFDKQFKE